MSSYYPVFLKLSGRRCIVIGGGQVALRKVQTLLQCGARVEVVSPVVCAGLEELNSRRKISIVSRDYRHGDLRGAFLAIAATGDTSVNTKIEQEAEQTGVPVNIVDNKELSSFIVPSFLRRGDVTIAVSTAGRSPALARRIRTRLEKDIGVEYAALAEIVDEVRNEIKKKGIEIGTEVWQSAMDIDSMVGLLKKGEREKAKNLLFKNLKGHGTKQTEE
ncbi:MAG: precorrin-2 dehydrogenase/sirohydrochlorin ferrochelatase family protein [Dehalococcoidia bacterium]